MPITLTANERKERYPTIRRPRRKVGRNRRLGKTRIRLPLGGFPQKLMVRLKYVEHFTLNPGAGLAAIQLYRANSLFDPNLTGVGHQPSNYDKLATIYDRYSVVGAKLKCYPVGTAVTNVTPGTLIIHVSEDGNTLSTAHASGGISNMLEQPRVARTIRHMGMVNNYVKELPLVKYFSAKKFFGKKADLYADPYSADIGANPGEMAFFEVGYVSSDDAIDPGAMTFRVEIEYIALMSEPKITDAS